MGGGRRETVARGRARFRLGLAGVGAGWVGGGIGDTASDVVRRLAAIARNVLNSSG